MTPEESLALRAVAVVAAIALYRSQPLAAFAIVVATPIALELLAARAAEEPTTDGENS